MSRVHSPVKRPAIDYDRVMPDELKAERLTYSATPTIRGMEAAAARIVELFPAFGAVDGERPHITTNFVKVHTEITRKLAYHKIGGNRWYSDRDLFDLMHVGTRPDNTVKVGA